MMKQQLVKYDALTFVFSDEDEYESAFIAGEEYLVLQLEVLVDNLPVEGGFHQDCYIRKYDNSLIVFLVAYFGRSKDAVESFLSSIDSVVSN